MSALDDLIKELEQSTPLRTTGERETVKRSGPSEQLRTLAQGITFGGADEAEAYIRSQLLGEDYDAALSDVRGRLEAYRADKPGEALVFEAGGAALPAIAGAVVTGGSSLATQFPMLARIGGILGMGALEGGAYAFNTGEGGFDNRMARVPGGMVFGAAGSALGYGAGRAAGATLEKLTDVARRQLGPRVGGVVEREIRKAMDSSGKSLQEVVDDVVNGRILADNKTIASVARAWRAQSAEAEDILRRGVSGRPDLKRGELMDYIQSTMGADGNALRQFQMDDAAARKAQGADYDRIFGASGPVDDNTTAELVSAFRRVPSATDDLNKLYRAQTGKAPFFRVVDGEIEFDRNPTLEEAEIMRRAISSAADREYRSGSGAVGSAYGDIEKGVRSQIDSASPELADVRATWSGLERAREAFDMGRKALTNPDQAAIDFEKVQSLGEGAVKAYRAGVTTALRQKASTGSRKSLPRNILDENTREGQVLRMVFPEDNLPNMERLAQNATDSQDASNIILGGSDTAITQGRLAEQGTSLAETAIDVASGGTSPVALLRLAGQVVKSANPQLTPKQAAEAARLVVETDPQIVARALTDQTGMDALYNVVKRVTDRLGAGGVGAGGLLGAGLVAD